MSSTIALPDRSTAGIARRPMPHRLAGRLTAEFDALERTLVLHAARLASLLAVCLGTGSATYLALRHEPPIWLGPGLIGLGVAGVFITRRIGRASPYAFCLALLAFGIGFGAGQWATQRAAPVTDMPKKAVFVTGSLSSVDELPDGGRRIRIARPTVHLAPRGANADEIDDGGQMSRDVRVRLRADDHQKLISGQQVRLRALLRDPSPPDVPGGRDPQREAFFNGVGGQGYALGPVVVIAGSHRGAVELTSRLRALRETIATRIRSALPGSDGAVASVMLTGLGTDLPQTDRDAFAASGLAHLLAVAGLHIGIVMGVVLGLTRAALALWPHIALRWPCRQLAALTALAAGAAYMALTGMHVPIIRSFTMACLVTLALIAGRRALSMRGLALAAAILLILYPDEILDVGFQMSFSAVAALIAGYEVLRGPMLGLRGNGGMSGRARHHVAALALTSLLAGAASAPFALYHFGHVQPWFVLANLIAVPLTATIVLPVGLLGISLMPLGLDGPAWWVMGRGTDLILWSAHVVAAFPAASIAIAAMPVWGLALIAPGLALLCIWPTRARLLGLLPIVLGLASPAFCVRATMIVSGDAGMIGIAPEHAGRGFWIEHGRADHVIEADWLRYWAASRANAMPANGDTADGLISCNPATCTITRDATTVLLVRTGSRGATLPRDSCAAVALLISAQPAQGICPGVPRIDRFTVWRDGPQAVWVDERGARVVSDRDLRGDRPWVTKQPYARRVQLTLPLATAE